jgi:hypothetical protein
MMTDEEKCYHGLCDEHCECTQNQGLIYEDEFEMPF